MKSIMFFYAVFLVAISPFVAAGTLVHGAWSPSGCGAKPDAPELDQSGVEAFNKSVAAVNDWQQKAKSYYECLIGEANTDNAVIAASANKAQSHYHREVEKINADAATAKKKLESN